MTAECENCGTVVLAKFARVFGDRDGTVYACIECTSFTDLCDGAAADKGGDPVAQ